MKPEQHHRVRELFEAALERSPAERAGWIDREAADDPLVRAEVLSLIDHDARAGSFLGQPIVERMPELLVDEPLPPGTVVGAYTVIREVGRGGMGRVYLASDARLGRRVALKALAPHLTRDQLQRERLRREARAAASLTHPGICTVYALEEIDGDLFIATEFLEGRTLREEIQSGRRPSSDEVRRAAVELSAALATAHERGITHRDLKPENIMLTGDGRLKILDFGLARVDVSHLEPPARLATAAGMLVGTPAYMAPEQLNGRPVDSRTDVFALGVLLYEYACGVHPFEASTPLGTLARVLESEAQPLANRCPQLTLSLADVIARCLCKSPSERFATAAEIARALERATQSSPDRWQTVWWRVHQLVIVALYVVSTALGWQLKEWHETPLTISIFIGLGVSATIGGVLRGHMIFTERMNPSMLSAERRRTGLATTVVDLAMAAALVTDAVLLAAWPLTAVLTMSLALGLALAAIVLEPATTRAAFGDG